MPPKALLGQMRQHWLVESFHWICDVPFQEDRSTCRTAALPFTLNLLRKALISLMHWSGITDITPQRASFAASLDSACAFVGIPLT